MNRILGKLALGLCLALLALPADVLAGRGGGARRRWQRGGGGGMGGGGGGGGCGGGGGGGGGQMRRRRRWWWQIGGGARGGGGRMGGGARGGGGDGRLALVQLAADPRPGATPGTSIRPVGRERSRPERRHGAGYATGTRSRNNAPAAGAGYANRNNSNLPNNAAAAAGAGYANRNQSTLPNAGAAAAGAGYANRNQSSLPNAGAAAAGAGYANRNQSTYPTMRRGRRGRRLCEPQSARHSQCGAAAAGAGYANRNSRTTPTPAPAAAGAAYANRNQYDQYHPGMVNGYWNGNNSAAWGAAGYGSDAAAASEPGALARRCIPMAIRATAIPTPLVRRPAAAQPVRAGSGRPRPRRPTIIPSRSARPPHRPNRPSPTRRPRPSTRPARRSRPATTPGPAARPAGARRRCPTTRTCTSSSRLVLFAQGQYEQAAAPPLRGPVGRPRLGLDDPERDVSRSRDLHRPAPQPGSLSSARTRNSAPARFVLAYHYLCQGHDDNAAAQLKEVVKLQPDDTLSAQLLAQFQPSGSPPPAESAAATATAPAGNAPGELEGRARPGGDDRLCDPGRRRLHLDRLGPGKPPTTIAGTSTFADGVLTLADKADRRGTLAGNVAWQDANHFTFRLVGAPAQDPGLKTPLPLIRHRPARHPRGGPGPAIPALSPRNAKMKRQWHVPSAVLLGVASLLGCLGVAAARRSGHPPARAGDGRQLPHADPPFAGRRRTGRSRGRSPTSPGPSGARRGRRTSCWCWSTTPGSAIRPPSAARARRPRSRSWPRRACATTGSTSRRSARRRGRRCSPAAITTRSGSARSPSSRAAGRATTRPGPRARPASPGSSRATATPPPRSASGT